MQTPQPRKLPCLCPARGRGDSAAGTQTVGRDARADGGQDSHGGGLGPGKQEGSRGTGHPVRSGRGHTGLSLVAPKLERPGRDEGRHRPLAWPCGATFPGHV